jgi:hypothetical protein
VNPTNVDLLQNIRVLLYAAGGSMVSQGYTSESTMNALVGIATLIATYLWTAHSNDLKQRVKRLLNDGEAKAVILNDAAVAQELPPAVTSADMTKVVRK